MKGLTNHLLIITFAVFYFFSLIIIAQLFTPESYNWINNTVSELAAQDYDNLLALEIIN